MNIKHLKVSTRLGLGFGAILLMLSIASVQNIVSLGQLNDGTEAIVADSYTKVAQAQSIMNHSNRIAQALRDALLTHDDAKAATELALIAGQRQQIEAATQTLAGLVKSATGRAMFATLQAARTPYEAALDEAIRLRGAGDIEGATGLALGKVRALQSVYMDSLDALIAHQGAAMETGRLKADATYLDARNFAIVLDLLSLGVGVAAAALISRQLLRQLGGEPDHVAGIASRIAAGDLAVAIATRDGDQHSLLFAIQAMRDSLAGIVGQVRGGADSIVTAATEIAAGNLDLSARTEQQASSLEETASSMEQLTATVKQNTESARQANTLAASASQIAVEGGAVVASVVHTMGAINDSASKIVDIISVIDGIAFQTNILALNAAVEAARAGEQGRGFAVVATEVRTLAHRSAAAAKEIKALIDDSAHKVATGTELVGAAGATMERIVAAVQSVTAIMGEISIASHEQEAGIEQINQAIAEMDTVTQQNAALVEQAAAAAEAQQDQAHHLVRLVGVFKLATDRRAAPVHHLGQRKAQQRVLGGPRSSAAA